MTPEAWFDIKDGEAWLGGATGPAGPVAATATGGIHHGAGTQRSRQEQPGEADRSQPASDRQTDGPPEIVRVINGGSLAVCAEVEAGD